MLDKGIRQTSTKRVGSIVVCSAFCPGSPKCDLLDSEKMSAKVRVRISRIMPQNVYTRPPFYSWEKFCMSSDAKWLNSPCPLHCVCVFLFCLLMFTLIKKLFTKCLYLIIIIFDYLR